MPSPSSRTSWSSRTEPTERDHDLGTRVEAAGHEIGGCLAQGAHLQGEQAGQVDAQAHAAQTQHGVLLVHAADLDEHGLVGGVEGAGGLADGDLASPAR